MTRCAAVLVNYHGAEELAQAVDSIRADAPDTVVLVVDNSHDAAEHARLRELAGRQVRCIDAGSNVGFGQACNLAWQLSRTEFVFLVNPDVRVLPGCTRALMNALDDDASLAAVAPRQFLDSQCLWQLPPAWLPTSLRAWTHELAMREPRAAQRLGRASRAEHLRLWTARQPLVQRALSGGVMMLRRAALGQQLPFDPRFFMYYEDSDLCLRLRRAGWRLAAVPAAQAIHHWRNLPHKAPLMEASARLYFDKHYPAPDTWRDKAAAMQAPGGAPGGWVFKAATAPTVSVPSAWQRGWLLELSPSALLQPAVGQLGTGTVATVSAEVLNCFAGQPVYGRLTSADSSGIDDAMLVRWN